MAKPYLKANKLEKRSFLTELLTVLYEESLVI